jgi:formylglycine-generating enzyme required for sulfatase activity
MPARYHANGFGLFDMYGNVMEWCIDSWDGESDYPKMPVTNPLQEGSQAIVRGGSWFHPPTAARPAARAAVPPQTRIDYIGFRFIVPDITINDSAITNK